MVWYLIHPFSLRTCCSDGGATPWGSWITCEEIITDEYVGKVYQVDPVGEMPTRLTAMGELGRYESFAYDISTPVPTFYVSRVSWCWKRRCDSLYSKWQGYGVLQLKCTCWSMVYTGTWNSRLLVDFGQWSCKLETLAGQHDLKAAEDNAKEFYPNVEGIDSNDGNVYFVSKMLQRLVILNLAEQTYSCVWQYNKWQLCRPTRSSWATHSRRSKSLVFVWRRRRNIGCLWTSGHGRYFTVMEGQTDGRNDESTGLAWSPNAKHMLVTYQCKWWWWLEGGNWHYTVSLLNNCVVL